MRAPVLYPLRQRPRREVVAVVSVFGVAKNDSVGALSQQFPRRLEPTTASADASTAW